ncbi:prepilin-type N-terminal cleavage/methylation domain-containing protein [Pseudanabaena sp. FACHB-2040]|uniref:pilus assembly FimT family protein n=1 Tax=Pseudanabaena sp. FACHB-2040 TaxID=2692859 RepID=UPI001683B405|nr:prepilin-type N-terminal cleavage/methylation domain-containing protein [Pseudanabaena sp. FACHB-2040]MBD2258568.1 prepilin-type N-terminal cleavage/methylation domain-containing protein [Pseudanabaena sp. FACHB-2040]
MNRFKSRQKASTNGGFTLIEALIVVIMVAILMGIAAPGWFAFVNRQRMKTVQNDLTEVFRQAQTNAEQLRSQQFVTIDTAADVPTVRVNGAPQVLGSGNINPGFITLSSNITPATISFDYRGMPVETASIPFVVRIRPDGAGVQQCVIVANLLGSIKTASNAQCDNVTAASMRAE